VCGLIDQDVPVGRRPGRPRVAICWTAAATGSCRERRIRGPA